MTDGSIEHSSRVVGWRRASFPQSPTRRCLLALAGWTSKRERVACDCGWGNTRGHVGFLSEAPGEEVYGERSALERGHVGFLSEAPGEEVYGERSALEGLVV